MKAKDIIIGLLFLAAIVLVFVVLFSIPSGALSDDALIEVNKLCKKHYGHPCYLWYVDINSSLVSTTNSNIDWVEYDYWTMTFEDGKLFVETQDGKWYIKMKEVIK